jgi:hypothetical protein
MELTPSTIWIATVLATIAVWISNVVATRIISRRREPFDLGSAIAPQMNIPSYVHQLYGYLPLMYLPFISSLASTISTAVAARMVLLTALKAITTVVTIIPTQTPCEPEKKNFLSGQCYEKVFSGYMAFAVLVSLACVRYGVWPGWGGWVYSMGMAGLLIVTRDHYTTDIVFGAALAYLSWNFSRA